VLNAWIQVQLADGAAAAKPAPRITMRCMSLSAVGSPEEGFSAPIYRARAFD